MRYGFGDYLLDTQRYEFSRAGEPIPLRPKVFQMLAYLLAHRDRVVLKEELLEHLWPDQYVEDTALNSYIMAVRRAIGDHGDTQRLLRTVRGRGYRFLAPVEEREQGPPADGPRSGCSTVEEAPALAHACTPSASGTSAEATPPDPDASHADGEYKPVTILCCALTGVLSLVTRLGLEALYRLLQAEFVLVQEVMQHYEGTITQHANDGFTAVFGAPVAQEDHARRAVLAALDLHQHLRQSSAMDALALEEGLALSMGAHSGLVVVGRLGSDRQRLVAALGAPTQLAARIQQRAGPGTILISAATHALVQEDVQVAPAGTLPLEGQHPPLPIYAVQRLVRRHAGVPRRPAPSERPFVGRQREMALLHDRLAAMRAGEGQVVSLVGPPGTGKTRLLTEFGRSLPGDQVTWYVGQCLAYGQTTPYLPVRNILRQVCGLSEGDLTEARTAALQKRLGEMGSAAAEDVALLLQILDVPVAPELLARLTPEAWHTRTFALLAHLLLDEAHRQPLVVAVENVHWIDATSEAWLAALVDRLAGTAVLLLMTYRPGYQPPWGAHVAVTQLALPPLHAEESQVVVQAVPGSAQLSVSLRQQIVARGAGNPFFLEELTWHAVEHGPSGTLLPVPETVHAVLAARIDRLPPAAKRLLQTAAVIGMEVSFPLLRAIAERPEESLQQSLVHLQKAEFLYETRLLPDPIYTFKHALTHEVAYGSLLQERRRALHARIMQAIENLYPDRLAEQVERLAHHALRGGVWNKTLTYCRQAGEKAMARWAYREAVGYFGQALSAFPHLLAQHDTIEQAIDLRLALRTALFASRDFGRILAGLREAEALAAALDDPHRLGQVSRFLSHHFYVTGMYDQAIAAAQRALVIATGTGDVVLHALANYYLGGAYKAQGDYRRAIDCHKQTVASLDGAQRYERFGEILPPAVLSRARLAWCHAELGMFAEGSALGEEGLRIAETLADPVSLLFASWGVGLLALRQGDLPRALPLLERAMGICHEADLPIYFPHLAAALGEAYALNGRVADALPLLTQALEQSTATEMIGFHALCSLPLGEAYLLDGHMEEAHALAARALALARAHHERGHEAYALRLLGNIAAHRDPPENVRAEDDYRHALALAEELGMRPLQAHCHLGLGKLYAKDKRGRKARAEISTALDLYQVMEMTFWLPRVEAALAQMG
jgi:class 3 adenylate cyclase/tetratricopeptide (TPR) repeat protein